MDVPYSVPYSPGQLLPPGPPAPPGARRGRALGCGSGMSCVCKCDQSQPLKRNIPHPPTNRSPSKRNVPSPGNVRGAFVRWSRRVQSKRTRRSDRRACVGAALGSVDGGGGGPRIGGRRRRRRSDWSGARRGRGSAFRGSVVRIYPRVPPPIGPSWEFARVSCLRLVRRESTGWRSLELGPTTEAPKRRSDDESVTCTLARREGGRRRDDLLFSRSLRT